MQDTISGGPAPGWARIARIPHHTLNLPDIRPGFPRALRPRLPEAQLKNKANKKNQEHKAEGA